MEPQMYQFISTLTKAESKGNSECVELKNMKQAYPLIW